MCWLPFKDQQEKYKHVVKLACLKARGETYGAKKSPSAKRCET